MVIPLQAERHGDDVLVSGLPGLPGWTVTVHHDRSVTLTPATGDQITQPAWRRVPVGAVFSAADHLTHDDRLGYVVDSIGPVPLAARVPGEDRNRLVATLYRRALAIGLTPRTVVAQAYGVPEETVRVWFTEARDAGALLTVHEERAQIAGRNA